MPPPVLVSAATTLDALAVGVPAYARALVDALWPGPLTMVCRQQPSLQWDLGDTRGTVAVRMPDHDVALELLSRTGPLAVSSANKTGQARRASTRTLPRRCSATRSTVILDDGPTPRRGAVHDRRRDRQEGRVLPRRRGLHWNGSTRSSNRWASRSPTRARRGRQCASTSLVFLVAAVVTYLLGVVAREVALRTGAVAKVRDRDVHAMPIPYFGGVAMLGGLAAAYLVAHQLPFLSLSDRQVFHDCSVVLGGGSDDLPARRARRPVRARRAHQVRRPGAGRRVLGGQPGAVLLASSSPAATSSRSPAPSRRCSA